MRLFKKKEYQVEFYLIDAFEIYHYIPLYNYLRSKGVSCCFVAENAKRNSSKKWFDYKHAIKILKLQNVEYKKIANYDTPFVFSTQDVRLVNNYKHKKINVNYGFAVAVDNFLETIESVKGFDLMLVHGEKSFEIVSKLDPSIQLIKVGYPRYSKWGEGRKYLYSAEKKIQEIAEKNVDNKPIIIYFPTWGDTSSIDTYTDELMKCREKYFIVTKAHHCTYRLEKEKRRLQKLIDISDVLLEGNFSFQEAAMLGEIGISDVMSGASTEIPLINKDIKMLILYSPVERCNRLKDFVDDFAVCVKKPADLIEAIDRINEVDDKFESRAALMKEIYSEDVEAGLNELYKYIQNNMD